MPYQPTTLPPALAAAIERMHPDDYVALLAEVMPHRVAERFWSKVEVVGACWIWKGPRYPNGYGYFSIHNQKRKATRFLWVAINGPIALDMYVCHRCDVRACVRPFHFFLGNHSENMLDMYAKGRRVMSREGYSDHCQRGRHSRTTENTRIATPGYRVCRDCIKEWQAANRERLNAYARERKRARKYAAAVGA